MTIEQFGIKSNQENFNNSFKSIFKEYINTMDMLKFIEQNGSVDGNGQVSEKAAEIETMELTVKRDQLIEQSVSTLVSAFKSSSNRQEVLDLVDSAYSRLDMLENEYVSEADLLGKVILELLPHEKK
jgi:virulence-associated protein VapD